MSRLDMVRAAIEAPSGDVTFVFSDIEGSTALFRQLGERYSTVLDEHRRILRQAWQGFGGYEVGTEGDSFFVAFSDAEAAASACLEAQRGLAGFDWGEQAKVRVRMGAHRGRAFPRAGDYVALAVHQAARVAGAAAGGQVLLTSSVVGAISSHSGLGIESLGRWRVRDFEEPVELSCLIDDRAGLGRIEPKLVPAAGHNLIRPLDHFFGRDSDLRAIREALEPGMLVSVVGPGGVGKTRLAIESGLREVERWPDGVWFVPLDSISTGEQANQAIASVCSQHNAASTDEPWAETLEGLRRKRALLILDNCEHVTEAVADAVSDLLATCDEVAVLATSRQPLGPSSRVPLGERVLRIAPLPTQAAEGMPIAARMFVQRAGLGAEHLEPDETSTIVELCEQLDGLPLAIELAASWAEVLTPGEIAQALLNPRANLDARDRRRPDRHRTITGALDWSFQSLDDVSQTVLRRVSVFADDFSLEAATNAVASGVVDAEDVRLALYELVSKSLLTRTRTGQGSRFKLLHTIRTYASGHCSKPERLAALGRVADHYAAALGPERSLDRRWLSSMAAELDNLLAVISTAGLEPPVQQKLMWSLGYYRDLTDQFAIGLAELDRHFATPEAPSQEQVGLLTLAADLAIRVGDLDLARSYCTQADDVASGVGCPDWDDAGLLRTQAALALWSGDAGLCVRTAELGLGAGLSKRGAARLHDVRGIARVQLGEIEDAADDFLAELELWTDLESDTKSCTTHGNLAEVYLQLGSYGSAAKHQLECLELAREFGQTVWIAHSMVMAAHLAAAIEDWHVAVRLQRAADHEISRIGLVMFDSDVDARQELLSRAADHLESEFAEAPLVDLGETEREEIYELAARIFRTTLERADHVI